MTFEQNMWVSHYISYAIKSNRGDKEKVRAALKALVPHLFNKSHAGCGDWCTAKTDPNYKPRKLRGKWLGVARNGVSPEAEEMWMASITELLDKNGGIFFLHGRSPRGVRTLDLHQCSMQDLALELRQEKLP